MRIHTDLAVKYDQKGDTVVGFVNEKGDSLFAVILRCGIKKKLKKKYPQIEQDWNLFHSLILSILYSERLKGVQACVICADYATHKVFRHLSPFLSMDTTLISLAEWRNEIGDDKAKSLAHNFVNKLSNKSKKVKNIHRMQKYENKIRVIKYAEIITLIEKYF